MVLSSSRDDVFLKLIRKNGYYRSNEPILALISSKGLPIPRLAIADFWRLDEKISPGW
jgi:hypothetical protein